MNGNFWASNRRTAVASSNDLSGSTLPDCHNLRLANSGPEADGGVRIKNDWRESRLTWPGVANPPRLDRGTSGD